MSDEDELERLKQQRLVNMRRKAAEEESKARVEAERQAALRVVLTPEARRRMANIRMVRPEFAEQLELQLIQLAQSDKLEVPVTDEQLKELLEKVSPPKRDISIKRY